MSIKTLFALFFLVTSLAPPMAFAQSSFPGVNPGTPTSPQNFPGVAPSGGNNNNAGGSGGTSLGSALPSITSGQFYGGTGAPGAAQAAPGIAINVGTLTLGQQAASMPGQIILWGFNSGLTQINPPVSGTGAQLLLPNATGTLLSTTQPGFNYGISQGSIVVVNPGSGYTPGAETIVPTCATCTFSNNAAISINQTQVAVLPTVTAGGSGGTNGACVITLTTGTGTQATLNATIAGNALTAINSVATGGVYTANPTTLSAVPVTGCSLTGATINASASMGVLLARTSVPGVLTGIPGATGLVTQASSSGSGTGATLTVQFAPIAANIATDYTTNPSSVFILGDAFTAQFLAQGTESLAIGHGACGYFVGNNDWCVGLNAGGIGSGITTGIPVNNSMFGGTDAGRNIAGCSGCNMLGASAGKAENNAALTNVTWTGNAAGGNHQGGTGSNSTGTGASSCLGAATGTVNFFRISCYGALTGGALTTGNSMSLLGTNVGNATCASGSDVLLAGTGNAAVDCPAAGTSHWLNFNNALRASMSAPTIASGFCSTPSVSLGASTFAFQVTVGSTCAAGTGIVTMSTTAMPNGYGACVAVDPTNYATHVIQVVPTSTTQITLADFGRTTGIAQNFVSGATIWVSCSTGV